MNHFDRLARYYDGMETLLAGRKLQACRDALWKEIPPARHVLLAGEGHGKCLTSLLRRHPEASVTCVDASAKMLAVARTRIARASLPRDRVDFLHADLLDWHPPAAKYDLVVTNFFLDCFTESQLRELVPRLANGMTPGGLWLMADFQIPATGIPRWRALIIHWLMYRFFRVATNLSATCFTDPRPMLHSCGLKRQHRRKFDMGLLFAELWQAG